MGIKWKYAVSQYVSLIWPHAHCERPFGRDGRTILKHPIQHEKGIKQLSSSKKNLQQLKVCFRSPVLQRLPTAKNCNQENYTTHTEFTAELAARAAIVSSVHAPSSPPGLQVCCIVGLRANSCIPLIMHIGCHTLPSEDSIAPPIKLLSNSRGRKN